MIQKVIKVGNSFAITIPKKFMKAVGLSDDSVVDVKHDIRKARVIVNVNADKKTIKEVIDPAVYKVAKRLLKQYLPAFKELAKK